MSKQLIPLEEYNENKRIANVAKEAIMKAPVRNGIECPDCGEELCDTNPTIVLLGNPPSMEVSCTSCYYKGYRLA